VKKHVDGFYVSYEVYILFTEDRRADLTALNGSLALRGLKLTLLGQIQEKSTPDTVD
jgi:hypothetical protein